MRVQSRCPYKPSEMNPLPSTKVSWLFDELSDSNASDDGLSVSVSVAGNRQILEVILTPSNDAILVAYQINAHYQDSR